MRVLLAQLPIPPAGATPVRGNLPLAGAYLQLAARKAGLDGDAEVVILPRAIVDRAGDAALAAAILEMRPDVLGFSCYLWNVDRSLRVAELVRRTLPDTIVVLGGPEVTSDNGWLLEAAGWDVLVPGEGEGPFAALLGALLREAPLGEVAGIAFRHVGGPVIHTPPRPRMQDLDAVGSPWLEGLLDPSADNLLLLETVRGCIFKCKFCYYPKAYEGLVFASPERVLGELALARERGAREVFILDPTLNQRRDFDDFLRLLARGNPGRALELYGEARAEGVRAAEAHLMADAGFVEVEIGLQSVDPVAQRLMDRRNNLRAFESGVRALRDAGVRAKLDMIVGLPGDTPDSVRRGMDWLVGRQLHDDIQVFPLAVLPGTAFRAEAASLGLEFDPRPPYHVRRTPTIDREDILALLAEAEDAFGVEFDLPPPPTVGSGAPAGPGGVAWAPDGLATALYANLDVAISAPVPPERTAQVFTLWLRTTDPWRSADRAAAVIGAVLRASPHTTLEIVIDTDAGFPFDVFTRLRRAAERPENVYLERFYEMTPGRPCPARRFIVLLPAHARASVGQDWAEDVLAHADIVWLARRGEDGSVPPGTVSETDTPGQWSLGFEEPSVT